MNNFENRETNSSIVDQSFLLYRNSAQLHNDCLDYLSTLENNLSLTFSRAFQESSFFCKKAYPTINVSSLLLEDQIKVFFDKLLEFESQNQAVGFVVFLQSQGLLTLNQAGYYISLINLIIENQNEKPIIVTSSLLGYQNTLLLRTDINPNELPLMIAMSTGAVASFNYWRNVKLDSNNPWNSNTNALKIPNWLNKGLRDLGGFVIGGIAGGLVAGPAGAVAGATLVGGAFSGAE